jgi:hypothetical protein
VDRRHRPANFVACVVASCPLARRTRSSMRQCALQSCAVLGPAVGAFLPRILRRSRSKRSAAPWPVGGLLPPAQPAVRFSPVRLAGSGAETDCVISPDRVPTPLPERSSPPSALLQRRNLSVHQPAQLGCCGVHRNQLWSSLCSSPRSLPCNFLHIANHNMPYIMAH